MNLEREQIQALNKSKLEKGKGIYATAIMVALDVVIDRSIGGMLKLLQSVGLAGVIECFTS